MPTVLVIRSKKLLEVPFPRSHNCSLVFVASNLFKTYLKLFENKTKENKLKLRQRNKANQEVLLFTIIVIMAFL
jgi:hypothetical protein